MKMSEDKELGEILEEERHTIYRSLLPGTPGRRAGDEGGVGIANDARSVLGFPWLSLGDIGCKQHQNLALTPDPSPIRMGEGRRYSRSCFASD